MSSSTNSPVSKENNCIAYKTDPLSHHDTSSEFNKHEARNADRPLDSKRQPKASKLSVLNFWWLWEIAAFILSLLFFVAIVVTLWFYNGKPLSSWKHSITINALISIFGTLMRVCLLVPVTECIGQLKWIWYKKPQKLINIYDFDQASRGPFGSLSILFSVGPLQLVSVGSLVTIATLALSPFIQQLVAYTDHDHISGTQASIPRTNLWDLTGGGYHLAPLLSLSSRIAVYNGILNNDTTFLQVQPNCASGNCTFSTPYTSLGVCSTCQNVTGSIRAEQPDSYYNNTPSNYSLPNGLWIADGGGIFVNSSGVVTENTVWSSVKYPISVLSVIASSNDAVNAAAYGSIEGPWAAECVLYYCVRQYKAVMVNEILREDAIVTYANDSLALSGAGYVLTPPWCDSPGGKYSVLGWNFTACDYVVSELSMAPLNDFVSYILSQGDFQLAVYNNASSTYNHVVDLMERLSQSLTSHIRSTGDYGDSAEGIMTSTQTYIAVRWEWLALPGALMLLAFVFLVVTMVRSVGKPLWKSSMLPVLFSTAIDVRSTVQNAPSARTLNEMAKIAEQIDAILEEMNDGQLKLVRT